MPIQQGCRDILSSPDEYGHSSCPLSPGGVTKTDIEAVPSLPPGGVTNTDIEAVPLSTPGGMTKTDIETVPSLSPWRRDEADSMQGGGRLVTAGWL